MFLPPEGAETVRLTVTLGEGFDEPVAYELEGQKEDGLFFFQLREKQTGDSDSSLREYAVFMDLLYLGGDLDAAPGHLRSSTRMSAFWLPSPEAEKKRPFGRIHIKKK